MQIYICQEALAGLIFNMFILIRTAVVMICIHLHILESFRAFLSSIFYRRQRRICFFLPVLFAAKEVRMHLNVSFTCCFSKSDKAICKAGSNRK